MAGVLLTGFEPFDGETVNPSWEVVKQLDGTMIAGQPVIARQLPCVFGEALSVLYAAIEDLQPRLVIAVGQAGDRPPAPLCVWRGAVGALRSDRRPAAEAGHCRGAGR